MFSLLGTALFCEVIVFSTPDSFFLRPETIRMKTPFGDVSMPFRGVIIVASLILIALVTYLHIFFGYWLDLERERRHLNLGACRRISLRMSGQT